MLYIEAVASVLLQEAGHYVDLRINDFEAPGKVKILEVDWVHVPQKDEDLRQFYSATSYQVDEHKK